jgi:hypothetical protein
VQAVDAKQEALGAFAFGPEYGTKRRVVEALLHRPGGLCHFAVIAKHLRRGGVLRFEFDATINGP